MKTKPLTFLLSLTFLFLFSGSVFGQETKVKREYWDNGKLKKEEFFKGGIDPFHVIKWQKNGKKRSEFFYKDSELDGPYISWHPNGRKASENYFKKDVQIGRKTEWWANGQKYYEEEF